MSDDDFPDSVTGRDPDLDQQCLFCEEPTDGVVTAKQTVGYDRDGIPIPGAKGEIAVCAFDGYSLHGPNPAYDRVVAHAPEKRRAVVQQHLEGWGAEDTEFTYVHLRDASQQLRIAEGERDRFQADLHSTRGQLSTMETRVQQLQADNRRLETENKRLREELDRRPPAGPSEGETPGAQQSRSQKLLGKLDRIVRRDERDSGEDKGR